MTSNSRITALHHRLPMPQAGRLAEGGKRLRGEVARSRADAPLVSVITVCWNSAKTIEQTFRSIRDQTYSNIEYIVVDGGSTDGTVDLLRANEDLIDYFVSEPDDGLYHAMNKGLSLAQGDYILMLNSDDWYVNDAVEALVAAIGYSGCDFVSGLERYVNSSEKVINLSPVMHFDHSVYLRAPIHHETMLIPSRIYDKIGPYRTDYRIVSDLDLMIRLFEAGVTHFKLLKQITFFRQTGVSNTAPELMSSDRIGLLAEKFPFLTKAELNLLANRGSWSGFDLLELVAKHPTRTSLVKAIHDYMLDHIERAKQGRGLHAHWKPHAKELLASIRDYQSSRSPKVSVILPIFNAEETLSRCIDSVLSQSLQDFELICINDQTPDNSQEIVNSYARRDKRIVSLVNPKNIGLGATRNRGVATACGQYIFHLDPDDTLPSDALLKIYRLAQAYGSDMTRGAYWHEQLLMGQSQGEKTRKGMKAGEAHVINTTLMERPSLLNNTEGHWSYLYRSDFAKRVRYPENLKMGQDSIFLVTAMTQASSISLTDVLVYHYRANTSSAMNTFNSRKYMDALEWRFMAWTALRAIGLDQIGEHLLFRYWSAAFFQRLPQILNPTEREAFDQKLADLLLRAGYPRADAPQNREVSDYFSHVLKKYAPPEAENSGASRPLEVMTLATHDHGGAGLGSQRRVEALRHAGLNAEIHCVFRKTRHAHVHTLTPIPAEDGQPLEEAALRAAWRAAAVVTQDEEPGLNAQEMISKTGSVVDFNTNRAVFEQADIVHLHWVAGMFDYANAEVLAEQPVAWTLADMNAFTGGCHYAEGCEKFRQDCRECPLLGGSDLAHQNWLVKREAYAKLRNLHIICPSEWLAERARASALFKDRPVHFIPNALPVERFKPMNRMLARRRLGLPLDRKLVLFGADSLNNRRKGGDLLAESLQLLHARGLTEGVEGVVFGASKLDLGVKVHSMGRVDDEARMAMIYAASDVFAFPSREDNAPLTVVESMLSGTPVVGFPVGNVPELVRHLETGYIARYTDTEDFAEGLIWALRDPSGPEALLRGLRAHLHARAHNDPQLAAHRHLALYQEMLGRAEGSAGTQAGAETPAPARAREAAAQ